MSSLDPNDPFDNGQQWQNVPSNSAWRVNNNPTDETSTTATAVVFGLDDEIPIPQAIPAAPSTPLVQPTAPSLFPTITPTPASLSSAASVSAGKAPQAAEAAISSVAGVSVGSEASGSTIAPKQPATAVAFEDLPPSYEAAIIKDRPQIHDNYDHLRGPPSQRGVDIKTRIPLDSTPSSYYQTGGAGASGSGSGTSARQPQENNSGTRYGSISPPVSGNMAQPSAPRLHGQVSQGRGDDELHSRDVDRLLGAQNDHAQHPQSGSGYNYHPDGRGILEEEPESHWGVVGDGKAWMALSYLIVILLPWSVFCFVWTLVTFIVAAVTMIVPPVGYLFVIATVTSWRALARVDLVVSRGLVSWNVQERYPHMPAKVFVSLPRSQPLTPSGSGWNVQGAASGTTRRQSPGRRSSKNLWHRGSEHLKATIANKHTMSAMSYFLVWKLIFALAAFVFVIVLAVLAIPFMVCLLPSLLIVSRKLVNGQFRWAVFWLTEKTQPIALP